MSIKASYSGTCPECGERWQTDDLIRTTERTGAGLPIWGHATCPTPYDALTVNPGEKVCVECWLIHPLTADCDEW